MTRFFVYIMLLWLGLPIISMAQNVAKFSLRSAVGCAPFTVEVIDESNVSSGTNVNYNYNIVGTPNTVTEDTFHTYNTPGEYFIVQTVANATTPEDAQDSMLVRVVEPMPPEFYTSNCKGSEAFLIANDEFYESYLIDWGDGNTNIALPNQLNTHDYGTTGTYTITVKGLINQSLSETQLANTNCSVAQEDITLIDDIVEGQINSLVVNSQDAASGSIELAYTTNEHTSYFLQMKTLNEAGFTTIDTVNRKNQPSGYTINQLNTEAQIYCFRLTAFDACDGSTKPSNEICSIQLNPEAQNDQIRLSWNTSSQNFQNYNIERNGSSLSTISDINNTEYLDTDVTCGNTYCYTLTMNESGSTSMSDTLCVNAFSNTTPPSVNNISTSVVDGQVILEWDAPSVSVDYYIIERTNLVNGNVVTDSTSSNSYSDDDVEPASTRYNYEITYKDVCGNISEANTSSPVFLYRYDNSTISWYSYTGWENGIDEYIVEKYDKDRNFIEETLVGADTVYNEDANPMTPQKLIFRIRALPNDDTINAVHSNFVTITFPSTVLFPNAFTPNGDGLNDIFNFTGRYISEYELYIYNRWGELIFFTDNPDKGWDGLINGKKAESGIYLYKATFQDNSGASFAKQGEVLLIK